MQAFAQCQFSLFARFNTLLVICMDSAPCCGHMSDPYLSHVSAAFCMTFCLTTLPADLQLKELGQSWKCQITLTQLFGFTKRVSNPLQLKWLLHRLLSRTGRLFHILNKSSCVGRKMQIAVLHVSLYLLVCTHHKSSFCSDRGQLCLHLCWSSGLDC